MLLRFCEVPIPRVGWSKGVLWCVSVLYCGGVLAQSSWHQKVNPYLLEQFANQPSVQYIVWLHEQADLSAAVHLPTKSEKAQYVYQQLTTNAKYTQASLVQWLSSKAVPYRSFWVANAVCVRSDLNVLQEIAARPEVQYVYANPGFYVPSVNFSQHSTSLRGPEWGLLKIKAPALWELGYEGQGVVVGGQDTGYDWEHPALKPSYRGWKDTIAQHDYAWYDAIHEPHPSNFDPNNPCGYSTAAPCDDNGHGTHTMGTMTGLDGSEQIGVAPRARWIACRNMERGWGTPATYLECFEWFLAPTDVTGQNPRPDLAPHIINNSWACPPIEGCNTENFHVMAAAVHSLRAAGVVVVVSAGNDGPECGSLSNPAAIYDPSFSVAALSTNDTIAGFSSRGPVVVDGSGRLKPDLTAPGVLVRSSLPGGGYGFGSGTSMAGPHVAGAVAVLLSAQPRLAGRVDDIEYVLQSTATPYTTAQACGDIPGVQVPNHTYGYGLINLQHTYESFGVNFAPPSAQPVAKKINLRWRTTREFGIEKFEIERSTDGIHFSNIGSTSSSRFHTDSRSYAFTDSLPLRGINYYRIKATDYGYQQWYSDVTSTLMELPDALHLYPNPLVGDELFIEMPRTEQSGHLELFSIDGRRLYSYRWELDSSLAVRVALPTLAPGVYAYRISNSFYEYVGKIVKI